MRSGPSRAPRCLAIILLAGVVSLSGCVKKGGAAIVLSKEHIPARETTPSPNESAEAESPSAPVRTPEQWILKAEMVGDGRKVNVPVEREQWEAVKAGDSVRVKYRQGKYTGTVWSAELE